MKREARGTMRRSIYDGTPTGRITRFALVLCLAASAQASRMQWTHFTIAEALPRPEWGTGGIPPADFDGDGDLDIVTKIWNEDSPTCHVDYRRNDSIVANP